MHNAHDVLEFWFGAAPFDTARLEERTRFWFGGDGEAAMAARDELIRATLEPMLERAARGEFAAWAGSPKRRLALIILFDQVPRNAYRGTAAAFAFDREALQLAAEGVQLAADAALAPHERLFFYLPLEHAESMEAQNASIVAFERLVTEAPPELRGFAESVREYARQHREVIEKFGRFPARNAALGRESTAEEREWLSGAGEGFSGPRITGALFNR
ncbi:MAG TPA: DUF924 family protein [Steroidobacteraceae bacterium]|nr:DUF924 family protein [Steroidobacteraceae bacterium]